MFIEPTSPSVLRSLLEYRRSEEAQVLEASLGGFGQTGSYIKINGNVYPLRRIWAHAYQPPLDENAVTFEEARQGLAKLGFSDILDAVEVAAYLGRKALRRSDAVKAPRNQHDADGPVADARRTP